MIGLFELFCSFKNLPDLALTLDNFFQPAAKHVAEHPAASRSRTVRPSRGSQRSADHLRNQLDEAPLLKVPHFTFPIYNE
jgi:hypothetical protein